MMVLVGSTYSFIYCRSVSCKCPDDPERKPSDGGVGRRMALDLDLLMMVLHEREPAWFPLILPGYLIAYT